jgi:hypothetical protein
LKLTETNNQRQPIKKQKQATAAAAAVIAAYCSLAQIAVPF